MDGIHYLSIANDNPSLTLLVKAARPFVIFKGWCLVLNRSASIKRMTLLIRRTRNVEERANNPIHSGC